MSDRTSARMVSLVWSIISLASDFSDYLLISKTIDFGTKIAEFLLPVLQIWRSRKRVAIQIQLMNIHVSECKYCCLHLVPKFGYMCDRQNWPLHPTDHPWLMVGWSISVLGGPSINNLLRPSNQLKNVKKISQSMPAFYLRPQRPKFVGCKYVKIQIVVIYI